MKWYFKILIGIASLAILLFVVNFGLNIWVNSQLPKIINKQNDSAYNITYKTINVSLISSTIEADNIVIVPNVPFNDTKSKVGIYAEIKTIKVNNFKIWDVLFNDKIKAKSITVSEPKVILYKKEKDNTIRESVVSPFDKIISVSDVSLIKGNLKIFDFKSDAAVLDVQNINLQLDGIFISEEILKNKIPFEYKNYKFSCDSIYYQPNKFYKIRTKNTEITKSDIKVEKFEMIPTHTRKDFVSKIPTEKDLNTLLCQSIIGSNVDWGFKDDDFYFHCSSIKLDYASANIYRSKVPDDDLSKKHLYNKLLRDLKFDLKVDTLQIKNSNIDYEEEKSFEFGSGKLNFSNFNLTATSIYSGFKKSTLPDVKIKVHCVFMKESPLNVNWKFNVMDKSDAFSINGLLTNFDAEKIIPFTKPYMNVKTKGVIDEMRFNFNGNDKVVSGEFAVKYDDLKFVIYKEDDRKKKNKLLTFVAKIFVKKDTDEKLKNANVDLERIPEKSFYNFLWRSIAEGLKKILI